MKIVVTGDIRSVTAHRPGTSRVWEDTVTPFRGAVHRSGGGGAGRRVRARLECVHVVPQPPVPRMVGISLVSRLSERQPGLFAACGGVLPEDTTCGAFPVVFLGSLSECMRGGSCCGFRVSWSNGVVL